MPTAKIKYEGGLRTSSVHVQSGTQILTDAQKQILENAALNCPVAKSLNAEIKQRVEFQY